ncbi:hypothetical protein [Pseudomonas leptonychotis]|uniref:hypothetical protein n=1 Tax=Pseudomonas leptonychotis TaxID=2448482 RepID=UPI00387059AE
MKKTRYIYSGPVSATSLRVGKEVLDVRLFPGEPVELPEEHEYTKTLLALKRLKPAPEAAKKTADDKGAKT